MIILIVILAFFFSIFLLVFIHEYGHFLVARLSGIKVERFSIGFGKPFWKYKAKSGIEYVIAPIMLGGYVKMDDKSFDTKPVWSRMAVMLAGITTNFIFAVLAFWIVFTIGIETPKPIIGDVITYSVAAQAGMKKGDEIKTVDNVPVNNWQDVTINLLSRIGDSGIMSINDYDIFLDDWQLDYKNPDPILSLGIKPYTPIIPAILGAVLKNSPASKIGLQTGDKILALNGKPTKDWEDFLTRLKLMPNTEIQLIIERNKQKLNVKGKTGARFAINFKQVGYLGVSPQIVEWPKDTIILRKYAPLSAFAPALSQVQALVVFNVIVIQKLVTGKLSLGVLGGPITILSAAGMAIKQGLLVYLSFLGLFSAMLAFINLLPIPALDGGNFVMLLWEAMARKPISEKTKFFILRLGMAFLLILIAVALTNDLFRMLQP